MRDFYLLHQMQAVFKPDVSRKKHGENFAVISQAIVFRAQCCTA